MQTIDKKEAAPRWILKRKLRLTVFETLCSMLELADEDWIYRGTHERLAKDAGLTKTTVSRAMRDLKAIGAVIVTSKATNQTVAHIVWEDPAG